MRFNVSKNTVFPIIIGMILILISCGSKTTNKISIDNQEKTTAVLVKDTKAIRLGANRTENYLTLLKNKRVGVIANQTSVILKSTNNLNAYGKQPYTHLVDSLVKLNIKVTKVFAPEHGFRGKADAGEHVKNGIDTKTQLPIISLYGKNKKPSLAQLKDLDILIFDIQDVGARFYTYISTLHFIMEACAEANKPLLVLDRPNPNGHYIDGPTLEIQHKSFVGMHPIPVVHGMTIGEYAKMINGEKWLNGSNTCQLTVIPMLHYTHTTPYVLPIKPSPNLPNATAISLYPSLCFFEGTTVNAGRGTSLQFQVFGSPYLNPDHYAYNYTPVSNAGAKHPKHKNVLCYGKNLSNSSKLSALNLEWLIEAYKNTSQKNKFFNSFFTKLAGTKTLQENIENGMSAATIKASWQEGIDAFKITRQKYLIYK
jgi:uncharacterized protein YbbC (DUF1343 family)